MNTSEHPRRSSVFTTRKGDCARAHLSDGIPKDRKSRDSEHHMRTPRVQRGFTERGRNLCVTSEHPDQSATHRKETVCPLRYAFTSLAACTPNVTEIMRIFSWTSQHAAWPCTHLKTQRIGLRIWQHRTHANRTWSWTTKMSFHFHVPIGVTTELVCQQAGREPIDNFSHCMNCMFMTCECSASVIRLL